jgi:hypothetical protein
VPPKGILPLFTSCSPLFSPRSNQELSKGLRYFIDHYQSLESESALELLLRLLKGIDETGQLNWLKDTPLWEKLCQLAMICNASDLISWITLRKIPFPIPVLSWARKQFDLSVIPFERLKIRYVNL